MEGKIRDFGSQIEISLVAWFEQRKSPYLVVSE